jgi:DNA-binding beta-propeller fold protein YncE
MVKTMKKISKIQKCLIVAISWLTLTLLIGNAMAEVPTTLDISPARIAFNGSGDLLVTDYTYGQVLTVAPDTLDIIGELNVNGRPLGVAWANDLVYVGNSTSGQVEVYNAAGQEQFVLGYGNYPIETPQDIAIGNGNVYVVDGSASVVKIFAQDGTFIGTIPENGYDRNILANPTAITVDDINQQIYVSDYGDLGSNMAIDPRIQVFNYDGSLAYSIDSGATNKYRFTMPQGLTLDGNNQLFVIDSLTGEIHIYDASNGTLLQKMKGTGIDNGPFMMKMPLDLVIDSTTNDVFVTNNMMSSIKVFAGAREI